MDDRPDRNLILRQMPEIALRIGYYFADFANLEFAIWMLAASLLENDTERATAQWLRCKWFSGRLAEVRRLANESSLEDQRKLRLVKILDDISLCNEFRNKLAHGQYFSSDDRKEIAIDAFPWKVSRKKSLLKLTISLLQDELDRLFNAASELNIEFGKDIMGDFDNGKINHLSAGKSFGGT